MLNNSWYSVISPENCSTILWGSWEYKELAAESLKLTASNMQDLGLVDEIIEEPIGGAHSFPKKTYQKVKKVITSSIVELKKYNQESLINNRINKFCKMGVIKE